METSGKRCDWLTRAGPGAPSRYTAEIRRVTIWGLGTNLILSVVKFAFGFGGGSQALVADGVHSLSDTSTDIAVLVGVHYWSAPADVSHPYGHGRIETMVSFFIGALLAAVGLGLAFRAVSTMQTVTVFRPGWGVSAAAAVSVVCKEMLYRWTARVGARVKSAAVAANAWHHRSDALSSVPVLLAVLCSRLWPEWHFLDHVAAVIVSVLILQAAWRIVQPALSQLIDAGATPAQQAAILAAAESVTGVQSVHAVRTRHIGPGLQVDLHVEVDPDLSVRAGHTIAGEVTDVLLASGPEVVDVLVHIEPYECTQKGSS